MKVSTGTLLLYFMGLLCLVHNSPNPQVRMERAIASSKDKSVKVKIEDSPYLVNIFELDKRFCAGTILSSEVVITADGCIADNPDLQHAYTVSSGSSRINDGKRHTVVKIVKQRKEPADYATNFLALLRVNPPIDLVKSPNRAIPLHPITNIAKDTRAKFTGWGCMHQKGASFSDQELYSENVLIIGRPKCQNYFSNKDIQKVFNTSICTTILSKDIGGCHGDFGAPLVVNGLLIAVMTWPISIVGNSNLFVYKNLADRENNQWVTENLKNIKKQ